MAPYVYSSMFPTGFLPSELHRNCGRSQEKRTLQKKPCHQFIGGRWPSILAGTRQRLRRDRLGEPKRSASGERLSQEAEAAGPVFRLPYERRLRRSATGSQRVAGSADRTDLRFLQAFPCSVDMFGSVRSVRSYVVFYVVPQHNI